LTHFTPDSLSQFLERQGFELVRTEPCFRPSLLAWSIQNWVKSRGWPRFASKILGQGNPLIVAAMFPLEYRHLKNGKTDVIKAFARKPT
jgi:hypothetical protein